MAKDNFLDTLEKMDKKHRIIIGRRFGKSALLQELIEQAVVGKIEDSIRGLTTEHCVVYDEELPSGQES